MAKPLPDKIAALKARKQQLAERLSVLESKARTEDRKRDTRRKIIVGGAVLAAIEHDQALGQKIRQLLAGQVIRPHDRDVLADLLPGGETEGAQKAT